MLVTDLQILRPGGWCSLRLQELCRSLGWVGVSTHISHTQLLDELSNLRRKSALLSSSPLVTPCVSLGLLGLGCAKEWLCMGEGGAPWFWSKLSHSLAR